MRFFILILIFINIGVWTYLNQNYFFQVESPNNSEELDADQLTLLNEHQLEALLKSQTTEANQENTLDKAVQDTPEPVEKKAEAKKPPVQKPVLSCYRWGEFSESEVAKAQAVTSQLGLKAKLVKTTQTTAERYWVYMPPAASAQEAKNTAAALKEQGITDLYIMNSPEWKNAISFGVFSDSRYADNMLKALKAKGITNVLKAPRGKSKTNRYRLNLSGVSKANYNKVKAKQKDYPKAKLQSIKCK